MSNARTVRCRYCRRMFDYEGLPPECCPECLKGREEQFRMIRDMVRESPGVNAIELSGRTGVPIADILRYIKSGLLEEKK